MQAQRPKLNEPMIEGGWSWQQLVEYWVERHGGWIALADMMISRGRGLDMSMDVQTVEKGLRRLARRGHLPGGQYGRWMIRLFGMPAEVQLWCRWMGQYHQRFSDMPVWLRQQQLALWDKPPLSESDTAIWLHLAHASIAHRHKDDDLLAHHLKLAQSILSRTSDDLAQLEYLLFAARQAMNTSGPDEALSILSSAKSLLDAPTLGSDAPVYVARWVDQYVYVSLRLSMSYEEAVQMYRSLVDSTETQDLLPFVGFIQALGLAYCCWKKGDLEQAQQWANQALVYAGDGGFVRLRVVALNLLGHMLKEDEQGPHRLRAHQMATRLDDEELLGRLEWSSS